MRLKRNVGLGIVGCGNIAEVHGEAVSRMAEAELLACHNRSPGGAKRIAKKFGCTPYTDYAAFLRHPGLDAVIIATPSGNHLEPAVKAVRADKHLIVEKPLEVTLARCDRIIKEASRAKVLLGGIFQGRFSDDVRILKSAVEKKRFGRIAFANAFVQWHRTQEYYDSGAWRGTWALDGGGALMNQAIHTVDLLQWLLGPVKEVNAMTARRTHRRIEVEDVAVASLRFKSGALGLIQGTTSAYPGRPRKIEIFGEEGSAVFIGDRITSWEVKKKSASDRRIIQKINTLPSSKGEGVSDPLDIPCVLHLRQFEDFTRALRGGGKVRVDGRAARAAVETVIAVYLAARGGSLKRLPLKFRGNPGRR